MVYLELNIAALRQLDIKGPDIAVIPLHLGSIADIPVPKTRVASNNLVALTKRHLLNHALNTQAATSTLTDATDLVLGEAQGMQSTGHG